MQPLLSLEKTLTDKTLRVVIVDDQEIFRHGLRNLLNDVDGFDVVAEASNCGELLKLAVILPIDLVFMNSSLADVDCSEAMRHLRELAHPPQVIILTTKMDDEMLLHAVLEGASGYLSKELPKKDVINALEALRRGELALLPSAAANLIRRLVERCSEIETALRIQKQTTSRYGLPSSNGSSPFTSRTSPIKFSKFVLSRLTQQENRVFQLMRWGLSNKQIAARLSISPYTVGKHVRQIFRKLEVANRTQAVTYASFGGQSLVDELLSEL